MVQTQTIHQVPNDRLPDVESEFRAEGATSVTATPDGPNTSTIVAVFPNSAAPQGAAAKALRI